MRVVVALETRFDRTPDDRVWARGWLEYPFWQRYLDVFDEVFVVARVRDVEHVPSNAKRADGPKVSFVPVPYYVGPWQFARRYLRLRRRLREVLSPTDAVIVRAPGTIGGMLASTLRTVGRPYGVEVVGDPYDVFTPGGVRSVLRPLLRWWAPRSLRRQCAQASAVAYVTADTLQQRYPASPDAFVTSYSSVDLPDEAFVTDARRCVSANERFGVLFIGSLEQLYKGPDVLIPAVALGVGRGLNLELTIVGDGKHRPELEGLAHKCGINDRVRFTGYLPAGDSVRAELDRADLFILPSRTEGLPRALIEAMARGLPCLASKVGGIPELLSEEQLVQPADVDALAVKMRDLLLDPARLTRLSKRNLQKAREFHSKSLQPRRRAFYEAVRAATLRWQRSKSS